MAKKNVPAIASGMGVGFSIRTSFVEKAKKIGLAEEVIHKLATPEGDQLLNRFVDLMAEAKGKPTNSFKVTVHYDRRLDRMIADGKYDWKNSDINSKNFPIECNSKVEVNVELVRFKRLMESDNFVHELDKQGLRPATLPELLAFGATYPEKQRELPIVALGSVWRRWGAHRFVACLWGVASGRGLGVYWFEEELLGSYCFACVCK